MTPDRHRHRRRLSIAFLALNALAGILHIFPSLVYATARPTTTQLVLAISHLGPVWVLAFGATTVGLLGCLVAGRYVHLGHAACGGLWFAYAASLWAGALLAHPHGTILYPLAVTFLVVPHAVLAAAYNDDAGRVVLR